MSDAGTEIASPEVEMMMLIYRRFRSRGAQGLLTWLQDAARRMLGMQPGAIVFCVTDDPDEVIWIGDLGADPDFRAALETPPVPSWAAEALTAAPPRRLRFVDEWYRRPAPPHRVWTVEAPAAPGAEAQLLQRLLERSRADHHRSDVVGWAIYRALEPASICVGFVGCTEPRPEALPAGPGSGAGAPAWRPLVGAWRVQGPRTPDRSRPAFILWSRVDPQPSMGAHACGSAAEPRDRPL